MFRSPKITKHMRASARGLACAISFLGSAAVAGAVEFKMPDSASSAQIALIEDYVSCWWSKAVETADKTSSARSASVDAEVACWRKRSAIGNVEPIFYTRDLDSELKRRLGEYVASHRPPPSRTYNPNILSSRDNMVGCISILDVDKYMNLIRAGRRELAKNLDCIVIPAGTEVVLIDEVADKYKQVIWEFDGNQLPLWVIGLYFLDARDHAVLNECDRESKRGCRERVAADFRLVR